MATLKSSVRVDALSSFLSLVMSLENEVVIVDDDETDRIVYAESGSGWERDGSNSEFLDTTHATFHPGSSASFSFVGECFSTSVVEAS